MMTHTEPSHKPLSHDIEEFLLNDEGQLAWDKEMESDGIDE